MATKEQLMKMGLHAMTPEQRREAASRGGKTSQENMRRRKSMQMIAQQVLEMKLRDEQEIRQALRDGGMTDKDINYAAGIIMVQTQKAMGGDTKAAEFVRDTSGQKPVDGLVVGNLDDKPFEMLDLTALTDEQLRELTQIKMEALEEEE
ncbi:MAG: hypothetical protein IIY48_05355 [Clostridia bacterium]|nr:hypothetical protein [Clostridia bacterium]